MLNSRYIYLHESLGLGPMWLNNNADITNQSALVDQTKTINQPAIDNQAVAPIITETAANFTKSTIPSPTIISKPTAITATPEQQNDDAKPSESEIFTRLKLNSLSAQFKSKSGQKIFCLTISSMTDSMTPFPDNYAQLMEQLLRSLSTDPVHWQFIRDIDASSWLNKFESALTYADADIIIFLSEMICTEIAIQQVLNHSRAQIINIPHPARLISIPQLKNKVWQDLSPLIY